MSADKLEPRNLGIGLCELQRIQDERLAEVAQTCGDCEHCIDRGNLLGRCRPPLPSWVLLMHDGAIAGLDSDVAATCECFERKDAK